MESLANSSTERRGIALGNPHDSVWVSRRRKRHRSTKLQLLTRDQLDQRTNAAKLFAKLIRDIQIDLAGPDRLSTIEKQLIEAFAGSAINLAAMNCQLALGQPVEPAQHAAVVSAMVRVASRLGLSRRCRDVTTPDPLEYARELDGGAP